MSTAVLPNVDDVSPCETKFEISSTLVRLSLLPMTKNIISLFEDLNAVLNKQLARPRARSAAELGDNDDLPRWDISASVSTSCDLRVLINSIILSLSDAGLNATLYDL